MLEWITSYLPGPVTYCFGLLWFKSCCDECIQEAKYTSIAESLEDMKTEMVQEIVKLQERMETLGVDLHSLDERIGYLEKENMCIVEEIRMWNARV